MLGLNNAGSYDVTSPFFQKNKVKKKTFHNKVPQYEKANKKVQVVRLC